MGVVATKLQDSNVSESTSVTNLDVKEVKKSKYEIKKPVAVKKFYQGCMKIPFSTKAQTPLVNVNKGRTWLRYGPYHRLNEKLNQDVQEEDEKSKLSTTSTSSDDLHSQ
ncbi:unknown_gene_5211 [Phodopus roborovskii]|uniref:Unknown_gene_5211 protein n=1 Tax=Phodopus roborovskii TaxID=109678 RepID=A0AAU9Z333_PHORO|nr:unknown_gene_5211 [Phodopus roborovskii]